MQLTVIGNLKEGFTRMLPSGSLVKPWWDVGAMRCAIPPQIPQPGGDGPMEWRPTLPSHWETLAEVARDCNIKWKEERIAPLGLDKGQLERRGAI